jgi:hypothetical protein
LARFGEPPGLAADLDLLLLLPPLLLLRLRLLLRQVASPSSCFLSAP